MFAWYGAADQPAVLMWLCKLHMIEGHVLCYYATVVSSTNLLKAEEFRRLHVESLFKMYTVYLLYVLDNLAATHNTSRRTAAGRPIALCTYLQPTVA